MNPQEMQSALFAIVPETVRILAEHGFQSHCIEGAALLTKVLQKVGISATQQLTVGVKILNPAYREFVKKHGIPKNEASKTAFNDSGAAAVLLGKDAREVPEGIWPGHLVVIVSGAFGEKHALLDLTITQKRCQEPKISIWFPTPFPGLLPRRSAVERTLAWLG